MTPESFKITMIRVYLHPNPDTARDDWHPGLQSTATGDTVFCADSWCRGSCGLPGLFLEGDLKAQGAGVGVRATWRNQTWDGERVYLPEEYRIDRIRGRVWF